MNCQRSFWDEVRYKFLPVTRRDLDEVALTIIEAVRVPANTQELAKLTGKLADSGKVLEKAVKENTPK